MSPKTHAVSEVAHETVSKAVHKEQTVIDREKRSTKLNETTPVDNINKNLQDFEGTGLMHEEVLPSHKL